MKSSLYSPLSELDCQHKLLPPVLLPLSLLSGALRLRRYVNAHGVATDSGSDGRTSDAGTVNKFLSDH